MGKSNPKDHAEGVNLIKDAQDSHRVDDKSRAPATDRPTPHIMGEHD